MISLLMILGLVSSPDAQNANPADAQRVKAAVTDLDKAFKDGGTPDRVKAIESASQFVDAQVIAGVSKGLRDREPQVQKTAIEALRFMKHPDALKGLEQVARQESKLDKDPELFAALVRAIGQHANPSSTAILSGEFWSLPDHAVIQARILSLGQIRTTAAVESLFDMMKVAGPLKIQPFMGDFRLALMVLTGADQGASQELWLKWWNENKSKLKVAPKAPELPPTLQHKWNYYWGRDMYEQRQQKRADRGQDDPGSRGGKQ